MRPIFVVIGLASAVPLLALSAQKPDSISKSEVRTSAGAERSVPPSLATLSVQLSAVGGTVAEAGARVAARTDSVRRALGTLGIPRDSLPNRARWWWWQDRITQSVSSKCVPVPHKPTEPDHCAVYYDTTYRATDAIEVRIHDLSRLGALVDTLMGRGITEISQIQFQAADVTAARLDALGEATRKARAQAEAIAAAEGLALGRAILLSTDDPSGYGEPFFSFRTGSVVASAGQPTTVVTPFVTVSATVYGRWELVKK